MVQNSGAVSLRPSVKAMQVGISHTVGQEDSEASGSFPVVTASC